MWDLSNSRLQKLNTRQKISYTVRPKDEALSVISGDFNFVENAEDRWGMNAEDFPGQNNANNANFFKSELRHKHGFHEWEQAFFTCDAGGARSRIDRMYSNQHVSFQIDHNCSCSALEWDFELSRHRAISFSRQSPVPRCFQDKPLQPALFKRKGWNFAD